MRLYRSSFLPYPRVRQRFFTIHCEGAMDFRHKIKSPQELVPILAQLKKERKRIVLCHGVYDLFHRGHLHQFEQARDQGDILVVSLTTDRFVRKGPDRPANNEVYRAEMVAD